MTGEDAGETIDGLHVYTLHEIGYGSGEGFKGWNCHHDWHAYYKGISKPNYTPEQIKKLNEKNISYNGKKYTKYEISQMQRQGERNVRALKRRTLAAQAAVENAPDEETKAVLQADYAANAAKLKESEKQLKMFCSQTGQRRDTFREQVDGFGRSAAQKAVHAAKNQLTEWKSSAIIGKTANAAGSQIYVVNKTVVVKGPPNGITQRVNDKGGVDRNYYDSDGCQTKQISNNSHGHKKESKLGKHGEHKHMYIKNEKGIPVHGEAEELSDSERRENQDIL